MLWCLATGVRRASGTSGIGILRRAGTDQAIGPSADKFQSRVAWAAFVASVTSGGAAILETTSLFIDAPGGLPVRGDDEMAEPFHQVGLLTQVRGELTQAAKVAMLHLRVVPPPLRIQVDVTDGCNFHCPMCSKAETQPSSKELGLREWAKVFERIRTVPVLREVSISGGEPFARPDILEILGLAKSMGLRVVLLSNGWFIDADALQALQALGVDRLMVSLNSLRESVHDESRGKPGSYKRIMQVIDEWLASPRTTDLCLATIVMESNCSELSSLATFVNERGLSGIIFQVLLPDEVHYPFCEQSRMGDSSADWYSSNPFWVRDTDRLRSEVLALLASQKAHGGVINPPSQLRRFPTYYQNPGAVTAWPCLGTLTRMYIDPFGDVRLCYGYPAIGNILRDDARELWRSPAAREIRRQARRCQRMCRMMNASL